MISSQMLAFASHYQIPLLAWFVLLPLVTIPLVLLINNEKCSSFCNYGLSTVIYLTSIPGISSVMMGFYAIFTGDAELLAGNWPVFATPVISMIAVMVLISFKLSLDELPGFRKISGLFLLIGLVCILLLVLYNLRVATVIFSSIESLAFTGMVLLLLFKVLTDLFFTRRR